MPYSCSIYSLRYAGSVHLQTALKTGITSTFQLPSHEVWILMDKKMGAITLNPYFKAEVNMFITVKSDHVHLFFFSINVDFQFWGKRIGFAYFFCAWNLMAVLGNSYFIAEKLGIKYDSEETLGKFK
jgi:hypothetical protein